MRKETLAKTLTGTFIALALGITASHAQRVPSATMQRPALNQLRDLPPPVLRVISPAPTLTFTPAMMADMSGWTKITSGPVSGSPALVRFTNNGPFAIVAVGGDGNLILAPIDGQTGTVDQSKSTVVVDGWGAGGVSCSSGGFDSATARLVSCHGRTSSGAARGISVIRDPNSGTYFPYPFLYETDGSGGTELPSGFIFRGGLSIGTWSAFRFMKAANGVWAQAGGFQADGVKTGEVAWRLLPNTSALGSNLVCSSGSNGLETTVCAARSANNFIRVAAGPGLASQIGTPGTNGAFNGNQMASSPEATSAPAQPLTSAPAVVRLAQGRASILIRDFDGSLKRINYNSNQTGPAAFSAWSDEGGYLAIGSQPSCVDDGAVPVCVIQGPDGAAYFKRLAPAVGL
jgi:hypothetical protein